MLNLRILQKVMKIAKQEYVALHLLYGETHVVEMLNSIRYYYWAGDDCADVTCYNPGSLKLPVIHRYDCAGTKFNPLTGRVIRKVPIPVCK
jgi:hypothetical protein